MGKLSKLIRLGSACVLLVVSTLVAGHSLAQSRDVGLEKEFIDPAGTYSQVVTVKDRGVKTIYVSGQVGRGENFRAHVETAFQSVVRRLESAGASSEDVVRIRIYVANFNEDDYADISEVRRQTFKEPHWPASTMVGIPSLFTEQLKVEIEAIAVVEDPAAGGTMLKKEYLGPSPNGFSRVVVAKSGGVKTIYVAGHVGQGEDLASQAVSVYQTLAQRLESAGASLKDLVKATIYIVGLEPERDYPILREARTRVLGTDNLPASTIIGVQTLVSDRYRIEMDAVAVVEEGGTGSAETLLTKEFIDPMAAGFTHVVTTRSGGAKTIYISGQTGHGADLATQTDQLHAGLKTRLEAAGATPADLLKWSTYIVDYTQGDGDVRGPARRKHGFPDSPASTLIGVPSLASASALIEIEGIAVVKE